MNEWSSSQKKQTKTVGVKEGESGLGTIFHATDGIYFFPTNCLLSARLVEKSESQEMLLHYGMHEILIKGRNLFPILVSIQKTNLEQIGPNKIPEKYTAVAEGSSIEEIIVKTIELGENQ